MVTDTGFHLDGNGHSDTDLEVTESMDQLQRARMKLDNFQRADGMLVSLTRQELSLLQKMLTAPDDKKELQVFLISDFLDEDEAKDNVDAYFEAKDLHMDTDYNIAYMFALAASNRKGNKTNRVAMLLDALQHVKYTSNTPNGRKSDAYTSPRSPIGN